MQKWLTYQKKVFLLSGLVLFLLFVGFSYLVHGKVFTHLDFDTTVRLQGHISRRFDGIFSFFSDIGKFEIVTVVLLAAASWYAVYFRKWIVVPVVLFFYGTMHFLEIYGKAFVHHLPPPHFLLRTHDVFTFPQFYVQATNSYPSGHAGRALFLTVFLGILVRENKKLERKQKLFIYSGLIIYDIVMLVSRIYLGEHWLSDVIGGSLLGAAFGILSGILLL